MQIIIFGHTKQSIWARTHYLLFSFDGKISRSLIPFWVGLWRDKVIDAASVEGEIATQDEIGLTYPEAFLRRIEKRLAAEFVGGDISFPSSKEAKFVWRIADLAEVDTLGNRVESHPDQKEYLELLRLAEA